MRSASKGSKNTILGERTRLAQVNLLPPEIGEGRQFQRVKRYLAYVLIGFVVLVGIVYVLAMDAVSSADDRLTEAQDEEMRLRTERTRYSAVLVVENHLNLAVAAESHAMLYEVDWRAYLDGIGAVTPESVTYAEVSYKGASALDDLLEPANLLFDEMIGAIAITGVTSDPVEYGNWIRAIDSIKGLDGTWVLNSEASETEDGGLYWTFTGEILISEDALSHRVVKLPQTSESDASDESAADSDAEEEEN